MTAVTHEVGGRFEVSTSVTPVDLMKGMENDCPIPPFGDATEYSWSPDSSSIVFVTQQHSTSEVAWSTGTAVMRVNWSENEELNYLLIEGTF